MKKILSIILALTLIFCFAGCETPIEEERVLTAPQNVRFSKIEDEDLVTVIWSKVENATSYVVTVNGEDHTAAAEYYYLDIGLVRDYTVTVYAKAQGYTDSPKSTPVTYRRDDVTIGVKGGSEVKSGGKLQLEAVVNGTADKRVTWTVTSGSDIISVNNEGLVTAKEVTGDKIVSVKVTSEFDSSVSLTKALTVTAKPNLTQEMIDELNTEYIGFEGFLTVNLYSIMTYRPYNSVSYDISTAMNGSEWYGKYEVDVGIASGLYIKNEGGIAAQVQVSLNNDDDPTPLEDGDGNPLTWVDAGLYNAFYGRNVTLDAFEFNTETWRYEYVGMGDSEEQKEEDKADFMNKIVSAANPYGFDPETLSLIVEEGEIAGIYAESKTDYTTYEGYIAEMELTVALNIGEDRVKVSKIQKYKHDEEVHRPLQDAIAKMQALDNYTTEFLNVGINYLTYTYDYTGYIETVTPDVCHFVPYNFIPADYSNVYLGNGTRQFTGLDYGYVNRTEQKGTDFYNTFFVNQDSSGAVLNTLGTGRAYADSFKNARPSFDFAAEIFTTRITDEETGKMYYYADYPMCAVATTFYKGLGSDADLYGIYATDSTYTNNASFTPYVVVNTDGYIESAGFNYYLGYLVGVVEISYYDFGTTETNSDIVGKLESLPVREVPNSWNSFVITDMLTDRGDVAADVYLASFLELEVDEETIENVVPVFDNVLGDTFGFGLSSMRGANRTIGLYYDVPLEIDYTLSSSLSTLRTYLLELGYSRSRNNTYSKVYTDKNGFKRTINIQPVDSSLDLFIYVWVTAAPQN
ncbi:MAG: hypothetical protein J1F39_05220 [Clostridiales bacterium]|nr:hypothetical protein [Clostridiales bacterium]